MYCDFEFVLGSSGFTDQKIYTRYNIKGKAYYENSDWVGVYSNQGNRGTGIELFDGSI